MTGLLLAAGAGLAVLLAPGGAHAQESLPQALDRAGTAANRALGEMLGVTPAKPARRKPAPKPSRASPKSAAKPDVAKPDAAKPDAANPAIPAGAAPKPPERPDGRRAAKPAAAATPLPPPPPMPARAASKPDQPAEPAPVPTTRPVAASPPPPSPPPAEAPPQRTALATVPLPPPRPPLVTPAALPPPSPAEPEAPPAATPQGPAPAEEAASGCPELAAANIATFAVAEPPDAKGACGIERPVRLAAVRMGDGRLVPLEPAALLRCDMALAVARWIREEVAPNIATLGSPLDKVMVAASYDCRPRNRVSGAKMSEHGRGNAMDTRGYKLEDGRSVLIGGKGREAMPVAFQERLKASACGRFKTILGPGSDGYHEEHLHVDLQPRRSDLALCRWAVRDMDAPVPAKPDDAKAADEKSKEAESAEGKPPAAEDRRNRGEKPARPKTASGKPKPAPAAGQ